MCEVVELSHSINNWCEMMSDGTDAITEPINWGHVGDAERVRQLLAQVNQLQREISGIAA